MRRELIRIQIGSEKVVLVREYSKIGYCYPRLIFKDQSDGQYVNLDLTTGFACVVPDEDYEDYVQNAKDGNEDDLSGLINLEQFKLICLRA